MQGFTITGFLFLLLVTQFKEELKQLWKDWVIYSNRKLDTDDDPNTKELGNLLNDAKGEFGDIIVNRYIFWSFTGRGVNFSHIVKRGDKYYKAVRTVSFEKWESMGVAKPYAPLSIEELDLLGLSSFITHTTDS